MRLRPQSPLRPSVLQSAAFHLAIVLLLVIWGAGVPVPEAPQPIDVFFDVAMIPQGPSNELGLGTAEDGRDDVSLVPTTTTPPPKEVEDKLSELLERMEAPKETAPPKTPELTEPAKPEKQPVKTVATPTTPKPATSPTPIAKPTSQKDKLLSMINKLDKTAQPGTKGPNSPGWKGGTSGTPLKTIPVGAILSRYRAQVTQRILRQWQKPAQITALPPGKRPSAAIRVRINASGSIVGQSWSKRSGNALLDGSAQRAVNRANPLPTPPPEIRAIVMNEQFNVTFKP